MKITVVGTGYVGLVTSACFAEMGNHVLCLDIDEKKIKDLQKGILPIYEPGLENLVLKNAKAQRLTFTTNLKESVDFGDIQILAVGTPPGEDGSADLQYILKAAQNIGRFMVNSKIIVNKSTVPVGTAAQVHSVIVEELKKRNLHFDFSVVSNPEFLKEGSAIEDFMRPDRIIIGGDNQEALHKMKFLYSPFQRNHDKIIVMDTKSAELTKYAANTMLATRISFMNELANLAEILGADIESVRQGIGSDPRIGYHFLYAGCGYGGSCFPKDVKALQKTAKDLGYPLQILEAVEDVNDTQKKVLVKKIIKKFGTDLKNRKFAIWGLSFKPNTDDMREAPSRVVIEELLSHGAEIVAYDPIAIHEAKKIFSNQNRKVTFKDQAEDVLEAADALIILTEWKEFKSPDFNNIKQKLKHPVIFDGRNLFHPSIPLDNGLEYYAIGRGGMTSQQGHLDFLSPLTEFKKAL